jgi:hypothetical protein
MDTGSMAKVGMVAAVSGAVSAIGHAVGFWGGGMPYVLAANAVGVYLGYTAEPGTYRRGLLYGNLLMPALWTAAMAADQTEAVIRKLRAKKELQP